MQLLRSISFERIENADIQDICIANADGWRGITLFLP
jgi:hypothetical protein